MRGPLAFTMGSATAIVLVAFVVAILLISALCGWLTRLKRIRKRRAWLAGSVQPETPQQKWHEDLGLATTLAVILPKTGHPAPPSH